MTGTWGPSCKDCKMSVLVFNKGRRDKGVGMENDTILNPFDSGSFVVNEWILIRHSTTVMDLNSGLKD